MTDRSSGTIKWFSPEKGYGFIEPDDGGKDVFVHYSAISGEGYRNLYQGQRVEFVLEESDKGPQASDVIAISSPGEADDSQFHSGEADDSQFHSGEADDSQFHSGEADDSQF